jgi:outer membrane protein assembly factor BamA
VRAEVARGYLDARAGVRARRVDPEHVDLCVDLDRGDAWHVERLAFPGASHVDREETHGLVVVVPIEEGPVYRIGRVRIAGRLAGPRAGYEAQVHEQPGAVFVRSRFVDAIARLTRHRHELSGEDVEVTPKLDFHRDRATVDVTLDVERAAR